jgi:hypothetical protein
MELKGGGKKMLTIGIFVDNKQKLRKLDIVTQKHLVEERSKLKKLHRVGKQLQPIAKQTSTFKLD